MDPVTDPGRFGGVRLGLLGWNPGWTPPRPERYPSTDPTTDGAREPAKEGLKLIFFVKPVSAYQLIFFKKALKFHGIQLQVYFFIYVHTFKGFALP